MIREFDNQDVAIAGCRIQFGYVEFSSQVAVDSSAASGKLLMCKVKYSDFFKHDGSQSSPSLILHLSTSLCCSFELGAQWKESLHSASGSLVILVRHSFECEVCV